MGSDEKRMLWVTWERQIRNHSMTRELKIPLLEILSNRGRFVRYLLCVTMTLTRLFKQRPGVVICQNPSIVLTLFLLCLRPMLRFKVAIDAHFGGVDASNGSNASQRILDRCNRSAELVIVTNQTHAEHVRRLGGNVIVCPDPLPDLGQYRRYDEEIEKKIFLICSYDVDEPFQEVFRAAEMLASEGFRLFASGNYRKADISQQQYPQVKLLGFVPVDEFYRHLFTSQVVIDLTDNDDCLVCGAYEALEAGKPLILSKKKALQEYFTSGTVFTENNAADIAEAIRNAYGDRGKLSSESKLWVRQTKNEMNERIAGLRSILEGL